MRGVSPVFALIVSVCASALFGDEPLHFSSGTQKATLIELYTSQGCSSCPPAEAYVSDLQDDPELWKSKVPVAFHVDYWDGLGWKDPFADSRYTNRQARLRSKGRIQSIYTPGFVTDGQEWRGFFRRERLALASGEAGALSVSLQDGRLDARYDGPEKAALRVALLGFDYDTKIKRGENRNRTLHQDFVALSLNESPPKEGSWNISLPQPKVKGAGRYALAVWVVNPETEEPLQATGSWLPDGAF